MKRAIAVVALAGLVAPASAQLVVDTDLGGLGLGSSTNLIGTTIGANSNADFYTGLLGNPIGFDASLGERVYRFTLASASRVSLVNNEGIFVGSDNDHYLTQSLDVVGGVNSAVGFIDEDGLIGNYPAGTYYLSVDTYGFSTEGPYDINLNIDVISVVAPSAIDLGVVGNDGDALDINTFGSGVDTELGLYSEAGNLLANNDDAGGGLQSQILGTAIGAGTYYIAVGTFNTTYTGDFGATSTGPGGDFVMSVNGVGASGTIAPSGVNWYTFRILPAPSSLALLGLGGVFASRRRRH
ncbi:MAG: PEP-CTERM sorting domain-containing protein [Phycisphaeraceae bacterium]|nr:PEP-CTERM sorting domain-containing protein [Phycisphaeraceae bacterium]